MGKSYRDKAKGKKPSNKRPKKKPGRRDEEKKGSSMVPPILVLILAVALIGGGIYFYLNQDDGDDATPKEEKIDDDPQNEQTLGSHTTARYTTLDGNPETLERYLGKVVLVDMFATWCGPCKTQIEELKEVDSYFSDSDVVILSIDTDYTRETAQQVSTFQADHDAKWPFMMSTGEFNAEFPASAIPTLFIIDQNGDIVYEHQGVESAESLIQNLSQYV